MRNSDGSAAPVVLRLGGRFDMPASRKLCDALIAAGRIQVVIDLSSVDELHEGAVAHLCHAAALLRGRVHIRGVREVRRGAGMTKYATARRRTGAALRPVS